jgi:uncharacterized membrane protein
MSSQQKELEMVTFAEALQNKNNDSKEIQEAISRNKRKKELQRLLKQQRTTIKKLKEAEKNRDQYIKREGTGFLTQFWGNQVALYRRENNSLKAQIRTLKYQS